MATLDEMKRQEQEKQKTAQQRAEELQSVSENIRTGYLARLQCEPDKLRYQGKGNKDDAQGVPNSLHFTLTIVPLGKTLYLEAYHRGDHFDVEIWDQAKQSPDAMRGSRMASHENGLRLGNPASFNFLFDLMDTEFDQIKAAPPASMPFVKNVRP
jgi:hypothetical protein